LLHHPRTTPAPPITLNTPNPALVTERAAQRLPRAALLLFCAAYVIPGVFGRDPWKAADITAFGAMMGIVEGRAPWLAPAIGGVPLDVAVLPYWLGAAFIELLQPLGDPALAARIPFALVLAVVLMLTWYATFHLARTEAAQPLPLAFGGEAGVVDYARAVADGALLALIASLGLLQLGHETTPDLVQMAGTTLFVYALAASPYRRRSSRLAVIVALPALAASGAPTLAVALAAVGAVVCWRSSYEPARRFVPWVLAGGVLAAATASALGVWAWRVAWPGASSGVGSLLRLLLWFPWPAWPLALWTLWRWRRHLLHRHISVPLAAVLVALVTCIAMGGSDRALLAGLPAIAVLAAFALPTLSRSLAAAIDWFSVFFFSAAALAIWVIYTAVLTGVPAKPAANVARLTGLAVARALAHRPAPRRAVEEPRAAGQRRGAVLAAADDAVAAAAQLRAQLPAAGRTHRAARAARRLHRGARHGAGAGRRARTPWALARRCARRGRGRHLRVAAARRAGARAARRAGRLARRRARTPADRPRRRDGHPAPASGLSAPVTAPPRCARAPPAAPGETATPAPARSARRVRRRGAARHA
jgi:type II secretory pathway pseudopilin PulG